MLLSKVINGKIVNILIQFGILDIHESNLKDIKNKNVNIKNIRKNTR